MRFIGLTVPPCCWLFYLCCMLFVDVDVDVDVDVVAVAVVVVVGRCMFFFDVSFALVVVLNKNSLNGVPNLA